MIVNSFSCSSVDTVKNYLHSISIEYTEFPVISSHTIVVGVDSLFLGMARKKKFTNVYLIDNVFHLRKIGSHLADTQLGTLGRSYRRDIHLTDEVFVLKKTFCQDIYIRNAKRLAKQD